MAAASGGSRFLALENVAEYPIISERPQKRKKQFTTVPVQTKSPNKNCKFLIIKNADKDKDLKKTSPFLIQKSIDNTCGRVDKVKKLSNGTLLVECKSDEQTMKLLKMKSLFDQVQVEVTEHPTLNQSKGIATSSDFQYLNDTDILDGLKDQNVTEIKRLQRKVNGEFINTNTIIFTFRKQQIPEKIYLGYQTVTVRQYVPYPLRCINCLRLGHKASDCKNDRICALCAQTFHGEEKCLGNTKCINCDQPHNSWSKDCPKFVEEFAIQKVKITQKISYIEAKNIYKANNPITQNSINFSKLFTSNKKCTCKCVCQTQIEDNNTSKTNNIKKLQENPSKPLEIPVRFNNKPSLSKAPAFNVKLSENEEKGLPLNMVFQDHFSKIKNTSTVMLSKNQQEDILQKDCPIFNNINKDKFSIESILNSQTIDSDIQIIPDEIDSNMK